MAYINQEKKKAIAPKVKAICAKYGVKGTLGISNHSTLILTISEGKLDFFGDYNEVNKDREFFRVRENSMDVNTYHIDSAFSGVCKEFLEEVKIAMNDGNHDRSDSQSDYFDVGWYTSIFVGKWNKPYNLIGE